MTDKAPVKGNCVDSGPSLMAETLTRLLPDQLPYAKYYYIMSFNFPS